MPKIKKVVKCPCGQEDVELERDEDGDWIGSCGKCGRNLGRAATRAEAQSDITYFNTPAEPEKKKKKGWLD
jgi:hypothetical protein